MPATVVQWTKELQRVLALARREERADPAEVSEMFLRPGATGLLRTLQAQALLEAFVVRGLLALLPVGEGKTLLSLLLPVLLGAVRPILLVPAALVEKTARDRAALARTWKVATNLRVESYEILGQKDRVELLTHYRPDLVVADECHRLANTDAGVTRRVGRYFGEEAPGTSFCGLTGTLTKHSLRDFSHLVRWALGPERMPLPAGWPELSAWDAVVGAKADPGVDPGALGEVWGANRARIGFGAHFMGTPGIVGGTPTAVPSSLELARVHIPRSTVIDDALRLIDKKMVRPDGWELIDKVEAWPVRRQLVLGFFYRWDPPPPKEWMTLRKLWLRCVRRILSTNRSGIDTAGAVAQDIDKGGHPTVTLDLEGPVSTVDALAAWRAIEPSYKPNPVPVWLDRGSLVAAVRAWLDDGPGILFCEHDATATLLADAFDLSVYGEGGFSSRGAYIDDAPTTRAIIATTGANSQGRNLQAWGRALVVSPPPNGRQWEQLLGRLHRPGQEADVVRFDVVDGGLTEWMDVAARDAGYISGMFGQRQKLELATWV
jgi:hypothetical protein